MHNKGRLAVVEILLVVIGSLEARDFYYAENVHHLANLAVFDLTLFEELAVIRGHASLDTKTGQLIDTYLQDFKESNGLDEEKKGAIDLGEVTSNPISVYRLIRRGQLTASRLIKEVEVSKDFRLSDAVAKFPLPTEEDLLEAIDAILRIQSSYRMNVTQFASGNVFGSVGPSWLRGVHCVKIGDRALELEMFAAAYEWFQEAKQRAPLDPTVLPEALIEMKVARTIELHDAAWDKEMNDENHPGYVRNLNIFFDPLQHSRNINKNPKLRDVLHISAKDRFNDELISLGLCSGENFKTSQEFSGQFCWLEFKTHAEYTIGPLKMEFLSRYPNIVQIHNAFFPAETDNIRAGANVLRRSTYATNKTVMKMSSRSSSTAVMSPRNDFKFSRKIARMVELNVVGSKYTTEAAQITSYTVGGSYEVHSDSWGYRHGFMTFEGDRLMTFMTYLNTVEQGGYTVFPTTLTYAEPIRGSAIFWFNLLSDGSKDSAMRHVACPVIKGQKWVATKWIPMYDQFLKKQCLLEPKERFQVPVNGQYLPLPEEIRKIWKEIDEANHKIPSS